MIARETIDAVQERISLIEVVGESIALRRQGSSFVGLCPFHSEKSPSFHVRDDRFFHCFGCGASGNVIGYVMRLRGLSFPDAIEELAQRFNIAIAYEGTRRAQFPAADRAPLFRANALAATFFRDQLRGDTQSPAAVYLEQRKIARDALDAFRVGFAARDRDALLNFLKSKGVTEGVALQAGLVRRNERGEFYDTFRGRVVFPICTDTKHVIGFGGRLVPTLFDSEEAKRFPKYLNSPESPLYQKSKVLFGLPQALNALRDRRSVYVVEGYMDVVGLWQSGVQNVVATCGTALTEQHIRRLKYLVSQVALLFDGDDAGRQAAAKGFPLFVNSGLDAFAIFLPPEHDPDTFAGEHGARTAEVLAQLPRVPLLETYIDYLARQFGGTGELGAATKGRVAEELLKSLATVRNAIERSEFLQRAALKLKVDANVLESLATPGARGRERPVASKGETEPGEKPSERIPPFDTLPRVDQELLHAVMALKDTLPQQVLSDADICPALHPVTQRFISALAGIVHAPALSNDQKREQIRDVLERAGETWVRHWKLAFEMANDPSVDVADVFMQCRRALRRMRVSQEINQLEKQLRSLASEEERLQVLQIKLSLSKQLANDFGPPGRS